jgi:hypothetical protein
MDFSTAFQPNLVQPDISRPAQSLNVIQQAHGLHDIYLMPSAALQIQPQGGEFTLDQSHASNLFTPLPAFGSYRHQNMEFAESVHTTPTLSIGPPTKSRKRKAPTLGADIWEPYKDKIIGLHVTQGLPLKEVKEKMEAELGFSAE